VALQALQAQGVTVIHGDMVLDQSAFAPSAVDPAAFDGERLRPYNATPEALLVNFKSLVLGFVPDVVAGVARVSVEPPLAGVQVDAVVPLSDGGCGDWRGGLQARFDDPQQVRFSGSYASRCGERSWPVAYVDPSHFAQRALEGMWRAQGGLLTGQVRLGGVPSTARPLFEAPSLPLADIISDVNKFSNNIMAQQVFLTLGRVPVQARASSAALAPELEGVGSFERSRARLAQWWLARLGRQVPPPLLENGSGLSRDERITADGLLALLRDAAHHPQADVLARSLPVAGVDGTAARMGERGVLNQALGRAHIKTGSLRDVVAVAGYVEGQGRSPWAVVAIINHPQAAQGRPVLDAILEWAATLSPK
jgi:serine-type D-Ala-D-Ala carboxypeptidase/endopeptidase (penicillin-binding protein 4)